MLIVIPCWLNESWGRGRESERRRQVERKNGKREIFKPIFEWRLQIFSDGCNILKCERDNIFSKIFFRGFYQNNIWIWYYLKELTYDIWAYECCNNSVLFVKYIMFNETEEKPYYKKSFCDIHPIFIWKKAFLLLSSHGTNFDRVRKED